MLYTICYEINKASVRSIFYLPLLLLSFPPISSTFLWELCLTAVMSVLNNNSSFQFFLFSISLLEEWLSAVHVIIEKLPFGVKWLDSLSWHSSELSIEAWSTCAATYIFTLLFATYIFCCLPFTIVCFIVRLM